MRGKKRGCPQPPSGKSPAGCSGRGFHTTAERVYISILPRTESIARRIRNISANTIKLYILFTVTSFLPLPGVGNPDIGAAQQKYIGEGSI